MQNYFHQLFDGDMRFMLLLFQTQNCSSYPQERTNYNYISIRWYQIFTITFPSANTFLFQVGLLVSHITSLLFNLPFTCSFTFNLWRLETVNVMKRGTDAILHDLLDTLSAVRGVLLLPYELWSGGSSTIPSTASVPESAAHLSLSESSLSAAQLQCPLFVNQA